MKRWLLLENCPALLQRTWMPPPDIAPELAPLRGEHQRLLAVIATESAALSAVRRRHETEDESRGMALKASFLSGGEPGEDGRATEEERSTELADAELRVEAAHDALVTFIEEATSELQRLAPMLYDGLDASRAEAEQKRAEAQRLLAEAEQQVGEVDRLGLWLDRESGKSALGHLPFDQLATPRLEHVATPSGAEVREVQHAA